MAFKKEVTPEPNTQITRKSMKDLFTDPLAIKADRVLIHQAFAIPGAGTETTLSGTRISGLEMVVHPMYGMIGLLKGKYFLVPHANVITAIE